MLRQFVNAHPITSFLIINYLISWSFLYPCYQLILDNPEGGIPPLAFIGMIGAYGPVISAILITNICEGKAGLKSLLRSLIHWKVSAKWYVFIGVVPIIIYVISTFISPLFGYPLPTLNVWEGIKSIPFWVLVALPFGPMGEELGWRGFLLPKLLETHSAFKSTFLVGLAWGFWHLASFTFPGAAIPSFMDVNFLSILIFISYTITSSFIFTFLYFKTKASVLIAILLHAFFNASANVSTSAFGESENVQHSTLIYCTSILIIGGMGIWLLSALSKDEKGFE